VPLGIARLARFEPKEDSMPTFPAALPHSEIEEIFPDVFFVTGTSRPTYGGQAWQFSRNMQIVRQGDSLTLVNAVRLDDDGLEKLDRLGKVKNVVKLGAFHGMDDAFYLDRYSAKQWALPGMEHEGGHGTDVELHVDGEMPFSDASLFAFESSIKPEALLIVERGGGIILSCDSLQNWVEVDRFFSTDSAEKMKAIGFIRPANIGPGWRQACNPQADDFARLKDVAFRHLLPAHGKPLLEKAHEQLSLTFAREFEAEASRGDLTR
jgi:hypothetical protein